MSMASGLSGSLRFPVLQVAGLGTAGQSLGKKDILNLVLDMDMDMGLGLDQDSY